MTGAAFVASFLPILVFQMRNLPAALLLAGITFLALGTAIAAFWPVAPWKLGILGSIPTWLFAFALHDWSVRITMLRTLDGIPIVALPVVCFLSGQLGAVIGRKIARRRTIRKRA